MLSDKLKTMTTRPGVYQMMDAKGKVVYVGKARNLKKRLTSYFRRELDSKTQLMLSHVVDIKTTITSNENDALLLEANLIKAYKPRYNILLRDDKSYPYLYLSTHDDFPRLDFFRGIKKPKGRYFGPYPSAGSVRENLALIQKLFKIRQCSNNFFKHRTRPCLQYQIKRCTAPCVDYISKEQYAQQVVSAILFLEGKDNEIIEDLDNKMEHASRHRNYELAAFYRDQVVQLRRLQQQQYVTTEQGDVDVIGVARQLGQVIISLLFIRKGRLIGHKHYFPSVPLDSTLSTILASFIPQYYLNPVRKGNLPEKIVLSDMVEDHAWIEQALAQQLVQKIKIVDRKTQAYKNWLKTVMLNAKHMLAQSISEKGNVGLKLAELRKSLGLPNAIQRIECFDISHTTGKETVASCVVFGEEGPIKQDYRRFNIKNIQPGDDYAAMRQAVMRRYTRLKKEEGLLPDLLMIDGGKGQLKEALTALEELQVSGVAVMAVAKGAARKPGLEKLFLAGRVDSIELGADSVALHLIQYIRDEAHRFAITSHRQKRNKQSLGSVLESIPGIGPKRRQRLLKHFGGLQNLCKASVSEISRVDSVNEELAQRIYDILHEA